MSDGACVSIRSVAFRGYKALADYTLKLSHLNILVGPNNCGKSTVIGAFRILAVALRRAGSRRPENLTINRRSRPAWTIPEEYLPVSLENVHTNYEEQDTSIIFSASDGLKFSLFFPAEGGCAFYAIKEEDYVRSSHAIKQIGFKLQVIPVLGPIEHEEPLLALETVKKSLTTPRASRHFRNYWRYFPDGFEEFADLVARTWPGMEIRPPEVLGDHLNMFCLESRISRELFWAGFGFQVWCQLLTHLYRCANASLIVVDEPEVYLHPDIQRQLIAILREIGPDVLLATHSTEIMSEADPSEILLVDKAERSSKRLNDVEGVQAALQAVGSVQNITLTKLARNRRLLFVEGGNDFQIVRRFARKLSFPDLADGRDLTPIESGGFAAWHEVCALSRGIRKALHTSLRVGAIFDRDYWSEEELDEILAELRKNAAFAHIHQRKELENYMLVPAVLERAMAKSVQERLRRTGETVHIQVTASQMLEEITESMRSDVQGQYIAKRTAYHRSSAKDPASITSESLRILDKKWSQLDTRMELVPGKKVLSLFRERVSMAYSVTLTDHKIISEFRPADVPHDLKALIKGLERFRTA